MTKVKANFAGAMFAVDRGALQVSVSVPAGGLGVRSLRGGDVSRDDEQTSVYSCQAVGKEPERTLYL